MAASSSSLPDFRAAIDQLQTLASAPKSDKNRKKVAELVKSCSRLAMDFKVLNRDVHLETERHRQGTMTERQRVDDTNLTAQNLFYRKAQISKEIGQCRRYVSKEKAVNLVSEEEFRASAPADLSSVVDDPHQLQLNRLQYELLERERLSKELAVLKAKNAATSSQNGNQRRFLDGLADHVKTILSASKPLQDVMATTSSGAPAAAQGMVSEEVTGLAVHLPAPLYTIYAQLMAGVDSFDPLLETAIDGDVTDAIALANRQAEKESEAAAAAVAAAAGAPASGVAAGAGSGDGAAGADGDGDADMDAEPAAKRARTDTADDEYGTHPLTVTLTITPRAPGGGVLDEADKHPPLKLRFAFFYRLSFVGVSVESGLSPTSLPAGGAVPHGGAASACAAVSLLSCLMPGDDGLQSPNPSNLFMAKGPSDAAQDTGGGGGDGETSRGESSSEQDRFEFELEKMGPYRPFSWCQWISGLRYLPTVRTPACSPLAQPVEAAGAAAMRVEERMCCVIGELIFRAQSWHAAFRQLESLSKLTLPHLPAALESLPSSANAPRPETQIIAFAEMDEASVTAALSEQHSLLTAAAGPGDGASGSSAKSYMGLCKFYQIVLRNKQMQRLTALVEMHPDYPVRPPVFHLQQCQLATSTSGQAAVMAAGAGAAPANKTLSAAEASSLSSITAIFREVNVEVSEACPVDSPLRPYILAEQIRQLQTCLDIFMHTVGGGAGTRAAPAAAALKNGRMYERVTRGRDRRLPFVFNNETGLFDQRR